MLTPLSIISLDQGKAIARRQVERLYAEPAEETASDTRQSAPVDITARAGAPSFSGESLGARLRRLVAGSGLITSPR